MQKSVKNQLFSPLGGKQEGNQEKVFDFCNKKKAPNRLVKGFSMVAGTGLEPATSGL